MLTPTRLDDWPSSILNLAPGRYLVRVPVARLLSDHDLTLAIHIVRGTRDGPTLGLLAGIHGDETPGVRCIRDLLAGLTPEEVAGTVVAIPVANPLAWQAQQRTTPERDVDQANLARVFRMPTDPSPSPSPGMGGGPGRGEVTSPLPPPSGSLTRRIASALEQTFFSAITHLIDYHCFGRETSVRLMLVRTGQAADNLAVSRRMARAFGLGVIREVMGSQGTTSALAAARGIPTCVAEMGGRLSREADDAFARLGVDGGRRVMHSLGMLETAPPGAERQLTVERVRLISPTTSGYYLPTYDLEDLARPEFPCGIPVRAGDRLGEVFDPYTLQAVETLTAPDDGYLIALARGGPFQVGGWSLSLAQGRLE